MTNNELLRKINKCNILECTELVPNKAYLYKKKCKPQIVENMWCEEEQMIILVENGVKVGGIYRMGFNDLHWIIKKEFQNQGILSSFLKLGLINKIWPENKSVTLCGITSTEDYKKKEYLANLSGMIIKNKLKLEKHD